MEDLLAMLSLISFGAAESFGPLDEKKTHRGPSKHGASTLLGASSGLSLGSKANLGPWNEICQTIRPVEAGSCLERCSGKPFVEARVPLRRYIL